MFINNFDPIALNFFSLEIRWYSLSYIFGILFAWIYCKKFLIKDEKTLNLLDDLITYIIIGIILGGRLGYIIFYNFSYYSKNLLEIFMIWEGGMSFHGGLVGVMTAMWLYGRKLGHSIWRMTDFVAPIVPLGLGFGRVGNFINGELWGKPTDVAWSFIVNGVSVHASQLYEAILEGFLLFFILWFYSSKPRPYLAVSGLFLLLYGIFRFSVEFYRIPDAHLDYLALGWVTMGQILSLPMILAGFMFVIMAYRSTEVKS